MINLDFVRGLIDAVDRSGIDSLEISRAGTRIRIAKSPPAANNSAGARNHVAPASAELAAPSGPVETGGAPAASVTEIARESAAEAAAASNALTEVRSPMVGTFYRSSSPETPAFVEVGSRVVKGQTLCILEAMKLMNELESEVAGVIREIMVENAEPVEYGQVLFRIEPLP